MNLCPHCSAPSISAWRKVGATPFSPAVCGVCKGVSYVSGWSGAIAAIGTEVVFWGSIVLSFVVGSFYGLLALPLGVVALTLWLGQCFPLIPGDDTIREIRRKTIRHTWLVVGVGITILLALFIYDRFAG
jgi:hypothetical protein